MIITIATLRAAGLTEPQILRVVEIADNEQVAKTREQNRIYQRNHRARMKSQADRSDQPDIPDTALSLSKEDKISSKEESKKDLLTKKVKGVRGKQSKVPLPADWQPIGPQRDPTEPDEFRDHARAKGYQYSDWHAAYRNFQRSPYNARNKPGAPSPALDEAERAALLAEFNRAQLNGRTRNGH